MLLTLAAVVSLLFPPARPASEVLAPSWERLQTAIEQYDPSEYAVVSETLNYELVWDSWLVSLSEEGKILFPGEPIPAGIYLNVSDTEAVFSCAEWGDSTDEVAPNGILMVRSAADKKSMDDAPIVLGPGGIVCNDGYYACCRKGPPKKSKCVKDATNPAPDCDAGGPGTKACSPPD